MKGVIIRKGGYWFSRTVRGKRSWVNLETRDYAEACKRAAAIRDHPLVAPQQDLAADVNRFLTFQVRGHHYTPASKEKAGVILKQFVRHCGKHATLRNVNSAHCQAFYRSVRARTVASTAESYMFCVRSLFRWAVDVERCRIDNPVAKVRMDRVSRIGRRDYAPPATVRKLLRTAKDPRMRFVLLCGFDAGLRKQEIIEARVEWFDTFAGLVHVRKTATFQTKDREERSIPMTRRMRYWLRLFLRERERGEWVLEPKVQKGNARYRWDFRRPFAELTKAAGTPEITAHAMRHSFASILASRGVSIYKIAVWLGDDVRVVQDTYAKLIPGDRDIHALERR